MSAPATRPAAAQSPANQPAVEVDQGIADVGPQATSLRSLGVDLRAPSGFDRVFYADSHDRYGRPTGFFYRASGSIVAAFPWSQYRSVPGGLLAEVPAGTVFLIGPPPAGLPEAGPDPDRAGPDAWARADRSALPEPVSPRADTRYAPGDPAPAEVGPPRPPPRPTAFSGEAVRQSLVRARLDEALSVGSGAESPPPSSPRS